MAVFGGFFHLLGEPRIGSANRSNVLPLHGEAFADLARHGAGGEPQLALVFLHQEGEHAFNRAGQQTFEHHQNLPGLINLP